MNRTPTVEYMRRLLVRMQAEVMEHCGGGISDSLRRLINESDRMIWHHVNANKPDNIDGQTITACSNCDWRGPMEDLKEIEDIFQRVAPGETMPAGECPVCGCLAHVRYEHEEEAAHG